MTAHGILREAVELRFSVGRLGFSEYLDFRLFLQDLTRDEKRAFAGWRAQGVLEEMLVDDYARFLSLDKITMYSFLSGYGLPVPQLRAVYRSRRPAPLCCLENWTTLADYLQMPGNLPVYVKPSLGAYGRGNVLITGLDGGHLVFGNGQRQPVAEYCQSLDHRHGLGWILQEPLVPHAEIAMICGGKISGVRVHTFFAANGPVVTKAIWKINVGREDSDNFRHGASGNLLGALDVRSGCVERVVSGTGVSQAVNPVHPVSGQPLLGFQLPYWQEVAAVVKDAQLAFPGYLCPGWDIAVCPEGPKILEVNFFGDLDLSQQAYRQGFLDEAFMTLLRDRGLTELLTGPARPRLRSPKTHRLGVRRHHWDW